MCIRDRRRVHGDIQNENFLTFTLSLHFLLLVKKMRRLTKLFARINNHLWDGNLRTTISRSIFIPPAVSVVYRFLMFFWTGALTIWYILSVQGPVCTLAFLTIWSHLLTACYFLMSVIRSFTDQDKTHIPPTIKLDLVGNVLFEMALSLEFPSFILYWGVLNNIEEVQMVIQVDGEASEIVIIAFYSIGYVALWIDFVFNTIKCYKRHYYYVIVGGLWYLGLNVMLSQFNNAVEWDDFITGVTTGIVLFVTCVHHYIVTKIYTRWKMGKLVNKGYEIKREAKTVQVQIQYLNLFCFYSMINILLVSASPIHDFSQH
eukprot:TRINITY_DN10846_c0_g1_i11.p1 TRINITY_DN10846_c0_g1~~TRINITY_DN10846_c0_g1_i11.p1  ORF type:complete len:316 (-),score=26.52 TRINITY_DN10846_c0_g1_i11:188-1135(-)